MRWLVAVANDVTQFILHRFKPLLLGSICEQRLVPAVDIRDFGATVQSKIHNLLCTQSVCETRTAAGALTIPTHFVEHGHTFFETLHLTLHRDGANIWRHRVERGRQHTVVKPLFEQLA